MHSLLTEIKRKCYEKEMETVKHLAHEALNEESI